MKMLFLAFAAALTLSNMCLAVDGAQDVKPVPGFTSAVVDTTGVLTSQEVLNIKADIKGLQDTHKVQVAILIIDSAAPETIEQYSMRVAEKWKVGKKGEDTGLLIVAAAKAKNSIFISTSR